MTNTRKGRRNTSALPALTPDSFSSNCSKPLSYWQDRAKAQTTVPDLRHEERLFQMYLDQKALTEFWKAKCREVEAKFGKFRANRLASGVGKALKPAHLDRPARKGNL